MKTLPFCFLKQILFCELLLFKTNQQITIGLCGICNVLRLSIRLSVFTAHAVRSYLYSYAVISIFLPQSNAKLHLQLLDLEYQRGPMDESALANVFDRAIATSSLAIDHRLAFSQRRMEFLEDFGSDITQSVMEFSIRLPFCHIRQDTVSLTYLCGSYAISCQCLCWS